MTNSQKSALESAIAHFERNGFWEAGELRDLLAALSVCADGGKGEAVARVQSYISDRPFSKGERVKDVVFLKDVDDDALLYTAPQAECAPRADADTAGAKPVAWIRMDHLRQAQQAPFLCRVEPSFRAGLGLVPFYLTAPQAECDPRAAQLVIPEEVRQALTHAAGGWRGAACGTRDDAEGERSSADYNRRAQVIEDWLDAPRADAEKDAARYRWLVKNCFDWAAPGDGDSFDHIELHFESDMLSRDDESVGLAIDTEIAKGVR